MTIRPTSRGGCSVKGACPYVSCRHHLAVDINKSTIVSRTHDAFTVNDRESAFDAWSEAVAESIADAVHTCSLDVAEAGPRNLAAIGEVMGICKERVRQIEEVALSKLRKSEALKDRGLIPSHSDRVLLGIAGHLPDSGL